MTTDAALLLIFIIGVLAGWVSRWSFDQTRRDEFEEWKRDLK